PAVTEKARIWAAEIADLMAQCCGAGRRLAVDILDPAGTQALMDLGIRVRDGREVLELARSIKSKEEIDCMLIAVSVCEAGFERLKAVIRPGVTENQLWSIFHQTNIAAGGEFIETRLLSSGGRTNPWFQECGERIIRSGDLICHDADMIGPYGYCV